jgi:hypothetical protein
LEHKPKDTSGVPEEITGVPKELASEVSEEQEVGLNEASAEVVVAPPPPARRMRAWDYWTS